MDEDERTKDKQMWMLALYPHIQRSYMPTSASLLSSKKLKKLWKKRKKN